MTDREAAVVLRRALQVYGPFKQCKKAMEECAEFIVAMSHHLEEREGSLDGLIEEIADVVIMMEQMSLIVGLPNVQAAKERKLQRLVERMAGK